MTATKTLYQVKDILLAFRSIPSQLSRMLTIKKLAPINLDTLVDLGCAVVNKDGYLFMQQFTFRNLKTVHMVDPNLEEETKALNMMEFDFQHVVLDLIPHRDGQLDVPKNLPAIAMHPGFSIDSAQMCYDIAPPQWDATLNAIRPSAIAFCCYSISELEHDLKYLERCGYDLVLKETESPACFRFTWNNRNFGEGRARAVVRRVR